MPRGRAGGRAPECGARPGQVSRRRKCSRWVTHGVTGDFYRAFSVHDQSREFNERLSHTAVMFLYTGKA